ncbi:MAG: hypothetical protein WBW31_04370 [Candidatus Sulfotelmatobacter sp.]
MSSQNVLGKTDGNATRDHIVEIAKVGRIASHAPGPKARRAQTSGNTPSHGWLGSDPAYQLGSMKKPTHARFSHCSLGSQTRSSCQR